MNRYLSGAIAIAVSGAGAVQAQSASTGSGQAYPSRPIRLVVGFTAGGATDLSARVVAQKLSENLGQQVVVDNRPGASSNLAGDIVAKSTADGHTLLIANATVAMPSLFAKLPFDVQRDLTPVSLAGYGPLALVVHPSLPAKNLRELIALAKVKPDALTCATAGVGSFLHLATALFAHSGNRLRYFFKFGSVRGKRMLGDIQTQQFSLPLTTLTARGRDDVL